ncbi:dihydrofolate reductase family protein [Nesterenkonia ebinurensis]|uniref:dihydrofolate reductase family protein n=1 Tax=Nesterenkonia ebinurensis TaxID=2608252 RepID=UPI00123D2642|nr:dihydrofolate reductase family protein [Nesterenkonia ebinurensis]
MTDAGSNNGRIVSAGFHMSLDGFVAGPGGELDWMHIGSDVIEHAVETMQSIDTMLMGKDTYLEQAAHWPYQTGNLADAVNGHKKVVFTSRPEQIDLSRWPLSRAAHDPASEIAEICTAPGKRIGVSGGARLFQTLLHDRLIDEVRVIIHPVTLGSGRSPWPEGLRLNLTATSTFDSGAVLHTYTPTDHHLTPGSAR